METIIGIGLAFPLGVVLGYKWRDRISQQRRTQYLAEHLREQREALERERQASASPGNSTDLG
jgi:hypothetical protein